MNETLVLCCRASAADAASDSAVSAAAVVLPPLTTLPVSYVGPRPGKDIDPLLAGADRVLVVGDDSDLAAVCLRLLRKDLLSQVIVGYATGTRTQMTELYSLPVGGPGVRTGLLAGTDRVPLLRNDVGGVLVGYGVVEPVSGTAYVDEHLVLRGSARRLVVTPDPAKGLAVTVTYRRILGFGKRPRTTLGRAVQIATTEAAIASDGVPHPRKMDRWTFYKHTEPLRLARGVV